MTTPETPSRMLDIVFNLDLRRGVVLCDAPSIDEPIPVWLWRDMLRGSEWREPVNDDDIEIHATYYVEFELEDQRPDPNGIVPIVSRVEPHGVIQIVTGRCDISVPYDSTLEWDLRHHFEDEIKQHAEDSFTP